MKNTLTKKDIERKYTDEVARWIMNGYTLSVRDGARGSQGEQAMVVLENEKEMIVVYVDKDTHWDRPEELSVITERFEITDGTLWLGDGEELNRISFYRISKRFRDNARYTDDEDIAMRIQDIRTSRRNNRKITTKEITNFGMRLDNVLKQHKGFKRYTSKDVKTVYRYNNTDGTVQSYDISLFNGKYLEIRAD